jgi:hypothetical protein
MGVARCIRRAGLRAAATLLIPAGPAAAQASVPFARWTPPPEIGNARTAGLADAVAALGDDSALARVNPAALAFAPRTLDAAAAGRFGTSLFGSYLGGAFHPKRSLGLGLTIFSRPVEQTARAVRHLERGGSGSGFDERTRLTEIGFGAAWRIGGRLAVGAALHAAELSLRASRDGWTDVEDGAWRPRAVLGLAFESHSRDAPRVNLALRLPTTWRLALAGEGRALELRSPMTLSAGASWDYHFGGARPARLQLALQNDLVRYAAPASGPRPPGFEARLDVDLRFGLEASLPLSSCFSGCGSLLQVRGGVARLTPAPSAADPRPTAARETTWHAGLSLAPGWRALGYGRFKLDAGVRFARRGHAFLLGVSARVPEGYRALASHE